MQAKTTKPIPSIRPVRRTFSTSLKKKLVKDIEKHATTVGIVSKRYAVSRTSVYKWIAKYSQIVPGTKQVIEMESEAFKTKQLEIQVDELLRLIGQQQVQLDLNGKILEHVSAEVGYDVKKKYAPLFSKTSDTTLKENTL